MLSPNTRYGAYLVFDVTSNVWEFYDLPIDVAVETSGGEEVVTGRVYLDPRRAGIFDREYDLVASFDDEGPEENVKLPNKRKDGWLEVEIGEFFTREEDERVTFSLMEVKAGIAKGGLVVEGIEIRPIIE
uniref:Uncharacterized protein n=2 Tax=Chenopodium quinoa TaxID=63459 RepID=A0A803LG13_CHEQI